MEHYRRPTEKARHVSVAMEMELGGPTRFVYDARMSAEYSYGEVRKHDVGQQREE